MKLTEAERGKQLAEALRLSMTEGHSERAIARQLGIARQTVRRLLGKAPPKVVAQRPQISILDPYLATIRKLVEEAPTIRAPAVLERLRPLGYEGGVSIVRDRLRHASASRRSARPFSRSTLRRAQRCRSTGPTSASRCPAVRAGSAPS